MILTAGPVQVMLDREGLRQGRVPPLDQIGNRLPNLWAERQPDLETAIGHPNPLQSRNGANHGVRSLRAWPETGPPERDVGLRQRRTEPPCPGNQIFQLAICAEARLIIFAG